LTKQLEPQVVVLDYALPETNGAVVARQNSGREAANSGA